MNIAVIVVVQLHSHLSEVIALSVVPAMAFLIMMGTSKRMNMMTALMVMMMVCTVHTVDVLIWLRHRSVFYLLSKIDQRIQLHVLHTYKVVKINALCLYTFDPHHQV